MGTNYIWAAFVLSACVLLPVTKRIRRNGTRLVSSRYALLILWSRWVVGSVAAGLVMALSSLGPPSEWANIIVTVALVLLVSVYFGARLLIVQFRQASHRREKSFSSPDRSVQMQSTEEAPNRYTVDDILPAKQHSEFLIADALDRISTTGTVSVQSGVIQTAQTAGETHAAELITGSDAEASIVQAIGGIPDGYAAREKLQEQLAQIDDNVRSWTLDESPLESDVFGRQASLGDAGQALVSSVHSDVAQGDLSANYLANLDTNEMRTLVLDLREEKYELQKLVLAQKASLDAERAAHERTLEYARATAEQLQESTLKQRRVTKIARRERAQRLKLESKLDTVNRALRNVQSALKQQDVLHDSVEA